MVEDTAAHVFYPPHIGFLSPMFITNNHALCRTYLARHHVCLMAHMPQPTIRCIMVLYIIPMNMYLFLKLL
ncbi:hypothetical protein EDD16DRAFT_1554662 [Pisolithus croceorrhizus]|nr:hypothetical protein EDD16DRAFT_1554662 [Pisolithus croceorrhizus]